MIWGLLRSSICWAIEPYEFSPAKFLESKRYYSKFNYCQHHFGSKFTLYSAHKKIMDSYKGMIRTNIQNYIINLKNIIDREKTKLLSSLKRQLNHE